MNKPEKTPDAIDPPAEESAPECCEGECPETKDDTPAEGEAPADETQPA